MNKVESYVWEIYEPALEDRGYEFADVEYKKEGPTLFLRLFIDHIDRTPITIDDCEQVNRLLNDLMDQDTSFPIEKAYTLEVSSPGIERPLKRPRDFQKFAGEKVRFRLYQAVEGQKNFVAQVVKADDRGLTLDRDGTTLELPYEAIAKANLYYEF